MLTFEECADYCNLSNDELLAVERGAQVTPVEACALVQSMAATPKGCRQLLQYLQEHLEHVEASHNEQRAHEVHVAINRFVRHHHFI